MDEYLWPVRNVAEYAYCPRLFYLMEVEGIHLPSADTEEGNAVHRRVDKPSAQKTIEEAEESPGKPRSVRSLTLTSNSMRLTATLDLAEIEGMNAVPVEYRRGVPKRSSLSPPPDDLDDVEDVPLHSREPWPTDRVQLALQARLLKEAGYSVEKGIIYYAAEKLRLEVELNDGIEREALIVLEKARRCAQGDIPAPLLNDPRCPRCSLQPFCLPDEINFEKSLAKDPELTPRKIWPPRDDGLQVIIQKQAIKIGVRGEMMKIIDKDGKTVQETPLVSVDSLALLGYVQISTQALHTFADRKIPVAFLSGAGRMVAMIDPLDSVSARIRRHQVLRLEREDVCLELARALIAAKVMNQRTLLMRNVPDYPQTLVDDLMEQIDKVKTAPTMDSVRGHEGQAAALYFSCFGRMFSGGIANEFDQNGRQRRPPPDPINACLSLAYTLLTHECVSALRLARLEPSIGAFHVSRPGRPALALDLMEPFRPLIADSIALTAFNKGELVEGHFLRTAKGCSMTDAGRKAFFNAYGRRMDTVITHPVFEYRLNYRRMLMLHARMIAAWLAGEMPDLSFLTTR